ncbi:MAG: hypothetical protein IT384_23040 [Deltaproteobacteria bacterium]|nr:hypothetical protein [Deltaproteobacteria bacterium]
MRPAEEWSEEAALLLSREELQFLRFTCDLTELEESPLGPLDALPGEAALEAAARGLAARGLLDLGSLRPRREVLRRLLIVAQPDARVVLIRMTPRGPQREVDLYERARALVPYRRVGAEHELGKSASLDQVLSDLHRMLPTRRSSGDFIDFSLTAHEYFAFSVLANDLMNRRTGRTGVTPRPSQSVEVMTEGDEPSTARLYARDAQGAPLRRSLDEEGTPIHQLLGALPREESRPMPGSSTWERTIASLVSKDLVSTTGDRHALRPFLHDLAIGLARRDRVVLTRFDFGRQDWVVRDSTLVPVQGSLFLVRAAEEGTIRIVELDREGLDHAARYTMEPLGEESGAA